ncbi:hypothetical protein [Thalassospira sp.]|uniref:hypothetical protein n=1 Tax=Thalassospira sp. TaxID=1912094 RepID=UPI00273721E4|nr:hypothetical protein [Thalassospira sp.]MDP2697579.1 hypothetical protein [Thalassospira sp.]
MSLQLIQNEIKRFLASPTPEVLCIKGKWGIGKTYTWNQYLKESSKDKDISLKNYVYVSLFGINSLEELKYSLFENTISVEKVIEGPSLKTLKNRFNNLKKFGRKSVPFIGYLLDLFLNLFSAKRITTQLLKSSFMMVRNQIVCLDDLERRGKGLEITDILGLASLLKEERKSKVVLLLNDVELGDKKDEFDQQIEKVVDISLTFDLTTDEALNIALPENDTLSQALRPLIAKLGITNIRVIRKIVIQSEKLNKILSGASKPLIEQAMITLILGIWSTQQPKIAPTIEFIRTYNKLSVSVRASEKKLDEQTQSWANILSEYPHFSTDEMDNIILDGVVSGYFNDNRLKETAPKSESKLRKSSENNSFEHAWHNLYHGSLTTNDDDFLEALYNGLLENLEIISPLNINSSIRMLRMCNQGDRADEIISKYIDAHENDGWSFYDIGKHHFSPDDVVDEGLERAFSEKLGNFEDSRNPLEVLKNIARTREWNDQDVVLMSKQSIDSFEQIFESLEGPELGNGIRRVLDMGRQPGPYAEAIRIASHAALLKIAGKSNLRARKIRGYGISLDEQSN